MRKKLLLAFALSCCGPTLAQEPPRATNTARPVPTLPTALIVAQAPKAPESSPSTFVTPAPQVVAPGPIVLDPTPEPVAFAESPANPRPGIWFNADVLNWWMPKTPIPVAIVTTADPNDNCAGQLGRPGTTILFGNQELNTNNHVGVRMMLGGWLTGDQGFGVEAGGFWFAKTSHSFRVASDGNGNPPIYLSGYNVQTASESSAIIADPVAQFAGDVSIVNKMQMWGTEANALVNLYRADTIEWTFLSGLRFIELRESFDLNANSYDLQLSSSTALHDRFATTNHFYGLQLGSRIRWQPSRFSFEMTPKLAIGATQQVLKVEGQSSSSGADAANPGSFVGGFFTAPSNIGRRSTVDFGIVPALELKLGCQLTQNVNFSFGYDILYINSVLRPGNQIDRNLNLSQNPLWNATPGVGPNAPSPGLNSSSFFVNGLNLRLEFRF